jgi:hypothetical protein
VETALKPSPCAVALTYDAEQAAKESIGLVRGLSVEFHRVMELHLSFFLGFANLRFCHPGTTRRWFRFRMNPSIRRISGSSRSSLTTIDPLVP